MKNDLQPSEQAGFDLKKIKVHHTLESTLIEVFCTLALLTAWVLMYRRFQGTEFLVRNIIRTGVLTFAVVLLLVSAYLPRYLNWCFPLVSIGMVRIACKIVRYMAVAVALATLLFFIFGGLKGSVGGYALLAVILVVPEVTRQVFTYYSKRQKR